VYAVECNLKPWVEVVYLPPALHPVIEYNSLERGLDKALFAKLAVHRQDRYGQELARLRAWLQGLPG